MTIPQAQTKYYEKDLTSRTIDNVLNTLEGELNGSDFNKVTCAASIQSGIEQYRMSCSDKTDIALRSEEHRSDRLGVHLEEKFGTRPARCHAHAIVAGKHELAAPIRLRMAKLGIGIDDVDNGCWLPESTAATPHPQMPKAPPHSRIHRYNYYFWLNNRFSSVNKEDVFRFKLKGTALDLYKAEFPSFVMLKKGQGLPQGWSKS